jgi:hypothetical protein
VVLDCYLHVEVDRPGTYGFEVPDQSIHELLKRTVAESVQLTAHETPHDFRARVMCDLKAAIQNFLGSSVVSLPTLGQFTNATYAGIDAYAKFLGALLHALKSLRRKVPIILRSGELNGIEPLLRREVEVLGGIPFPRP